MNNDLQAWGWNDHFAAHFAPFAEQDVSVGRIVLEHKRLYRVVTEHGELLGEVTGRFRYAATGREDYPAVGIGWSSAPASRRNGRPSTPCSRA